MRFSAADLLPGRDGRAYHLDIPAAALAPRVILCGDPGRVTVVASKFLHSHEGPFTHRGLTTVTGVSKHGQRISVTTSGMGTPSVEIVMRELSALRRVNILTGELLNGTPEPLSVIRLGTSGSLQRHIPVGASIITDWAFGLDNSALFYETPLPEGGETLERLLTTELTKAFRPGSRFAGRLMPYVTRACPLAVGRLRKAAESLGYEFAVGSTVTAPGLFAAQGRPVEGMQCSIPDLDLVLAGLPLGPEQQALNMEMEAAIVCHMGRCWGWQTGAICIAINNRRDETANTTDYEAAVLRAAEIAIDSFAVSV